MTTRLQWRLARRSRAHANFTPGQDLRSARVWRVLTKMIRTLVSPCFTMNHNTTRRSLCREDRSSPEKGLLRERRLSPQGAGAGAGEGTGVAASLGDKVHEPLGLSVAKTMSVTITTNWKSRSTAQLFAHTFRGAHWPTPSLPASIRPSKTGLLLPLAAGWGSLEGRGHGRGSGSGTGTDGTGRWIQ